MLQLWKKTQFSHGAFSGEEERSLGEISCPLPAAEENEENPFFPLLLISSRLAASPCSSRHGNYDFQNGEEEEEEEEELGRDDIIRRNREEREREGMGDSRAKEPRRRKKK